MGNDGGSIPTRRELVKNAARNPNTSEVKASQLESQTHAWTYCPLSQRLLATPVVSDCAGTLYNKDAVLEYLLPSDDHPANSIKGDYEEVLAGRIKSLRDIVEVKFQTEKDEITKGEKRICPITSKELGPHTKAIYVVPCGHAFSEAAIKEVSGDACIQCNEPYKSEDIIPILPLLKGDVNRLATRIAKLREESLTHSLKTAPGGKKKKKKKKKHESNGIETEPTGTNYDSTVAVSGFSAKPNSEIVLEKSKKRLAEIDLYGDENPLPQSRSGTATPSGGIKNAATASLTAKVLNEQEEMNKRRKLGLNDNLKSLFSSSGANGSSQKGGDFMTRGFSVPKRA